MLTQRKLLLRRNAWFRQQLPAPGPHPSSPAKTSAEEKAS